MLVRNQSKLFIKSVFLVLIQQPNTVFKLKSLGFLIKALGFLLQTMQIQSKFQISTTDLHFYSKSLISTPNPGVLLQIPDFYSNPGFLLQIWDFYFKSENSTPIGRISTLNPGFMLQIPNLSSKSRSYQCKTILNTICLSVWVFVWLFATCKLYTGEQIGPIFLWNLT